MNTHRLQRVTLRRRLTSARLCRSGRLARGLAAFFILPMMLCSTATLAQEAGAPGEGRPIVVSAGQSKVFDTPWPVQRISVTDPQIADVEAISPTQVLLLGRRIGTTDLILWSAGDDLWQRRVDVHVDLARLRQELTDLFPRSDVDVTQSQDVVIVTGSLRDAVQAERLSQFLTAADRATGLKYVDMTAVAPRPDAPPAEDAAYVDAARLQHELDRLFPDATLEVRQSRDVFIISGLLRRVEQVEQLRRYLEALEIAAEQYAERASRSRTPAQTQPADPATEQGAVGPLDPVVASAGFRYVDMTSVAGVQQVQLQVRIAEVSRVALRTLTINALQTGHHGNTFFGALQPGPSVGGALVPMNIGPPEGALAGPRGVPFTFNADVSVPPAVTMFFGFPRADLQFFLQALAENQYLRILAEPSLVALSGEEASFLAGGEFPIPVVQTAAAGALSITIEYKEFGVRLRFRPTVLGDGTIRLHLAPEVSDLTEAGAVVIQGFQVPALITRRAETTLELKSGQTFAMAGLLSSRNEGRHSRVPGLGDLPVLGALFRSVRYTRGETELVVLVTAALVEPLSLDAPPPVPGVTHSVPNDWEVYFEGRVEGRAAPALSPADAEWLQELGFDHLRGPGAWETYEQGPAQSRSSLGGPPVPAAGRRGSQSDAGEVRSGSSLSLAGETPAVPAETPTIPVEIPAVPSDTPDGAPVPEPAAHQTVRDQEEW